MEQNEKTPGFAALLLATIDDVGVDPVVRNAAAVAFKNLVRRFWSTPAVPSGAAAEMAEAVDADQFVLHDGDRASIKACIISLMMRLPIKLQRQFSEAVSIIARHDFPDRWPELLPEINACLQSANVDMMIPALQTMDSISVRYRTSTESEAIVHEIYHILEGFADTLNHLFSTALALLQQQTATGAELLKLLRVAYLVVRIYASLNALELPDKFVGSLPLWFNGMQSLLMFETPEIKALMDSADDDVLDEESLLGVVVALKAEICDTVTMFASKYEDDAGALIKPYVQAIWTLLVTTAAKQAFDILVSSGIKFLTCISERREYAELFTTENALEAICQSVIVPNMQLRDSDEELFDDDPEGWIRQDLEGSDVDTRRRASCDLVRGLSRFFEERISTIFKHYLASLFAQYATDPATHWKSKDTALFLIAALAVKSRLQALGATQVSAFVDVLSVLREHVVPELARPPQSSGPAMLQAACVKYIYTFRNQVDAALVPQVATVLVAHLSSSSVVVSSYAAATLERLCVLRESPAGEPKLNSVLLQQIAGDIFARALASLQQPSAEENEYMMRLIMRAVSNMRGLVVQHLNVLVGALCHKAMTVSQNPRKPVFNHVMFETLSALIKYSCTENSALVSAFEEALFPVFDVIFTRDVVEFHPYVFQLLSQLLELHAPGSMSAPFFELYPKLKLAQLWEREGNVPPLVRLLVAYVRCMGPHLVPDDENLMPLLGIFRKLVMSRKTDRLGFRLLEALCECLPMERIAPHLSSIFIVALQRITSGKTPIVVSSFIVFLSLLIGLYGPGPVVSGFESVQSGIFSRVLESLYKSELHRVSTVRDRKVCAVGVTRLLCESAEVLDGVYASSWGMLLGQLVEMLATPPGSLSVADGEIEDGSGGSMVGEPAGGNGGYQAAYEPLAYAASTTVDPFPNHPEGSVFLALRLKALSEAMPGKVRCGCVFVCRLLTDSMCDGVCV
jgi:exportin-2 (importin alpha re-exporter)